jgi:hypothetical protein
MSLVPQDIGNVLLMNAQKQEKVEEGEKKMEKQEKIIGKLLTIMTTQTIILFISMVLTAWYMKDQFVDENGRLVDSDGDVV